MRDQYDQPVPRDLVLLPQAIDSEDAERLCQCRWYKDLDGVLFVPFQDTSSYLKDAYAWDTWPLRAGRELLVHLIPTPLKRWSKPDGFYHA
tara:strand:+ start:86 stop:358 length:273 start_codon:yes stop_codon:yes gene_type:complete